jgi:ABC-type transport system involved in cytochrome bd biosynthesis fused ATPase/permease subunit
MSSTKIVHVSWKRGREAASGSRTYKRATMEVLCLDETFISKTVLQLYSSISLSLGAGSLPHFYVLSIVLFIPHLKRKPR